MVGRGLPTPPNSMEATRLRRDETLVTTVSEQGLIAHCVKCSPSGNLTTLVFTEIPRSYQPKVAQQVMRQQPDVEQVGFIEAPLCSQAVTRLQMMGGEFCGNATCALGWVLSKKGDFQSGLIEVSGKQEPVLVSVIADRVKMQVPIKCSLSSIKNSSGKTIIELEGITHVICSRPPPLNACAEARRVLDELGLTSRKAAGVLYAEPYKDGIAMTPIVWVRDTGSLVQEGACASGSICVAMWRAAISGEESADLPIYQPSGSIIRALVRISNDAFTKASIVGKVEILEESALTLYV